MTDKSLPCHAEILRDAQAMIDCIVWFLSDDVGKWSWSDVARHCDDDRLLVGMTKAEERQIRFVASALIAARIEREMRYV